MMRGVQSSRFVLRCFVEQVFAAMFQGRLDHFAMEVEGSICPAPLDNGAAAVVFFRFLAFERVLVSSTDESPKPPLEIDLVASRWIFFGMLVLIAGAALASWWFRRTEGQVPEAVARDPLLTQGYRIYQSRCSACHGPWGRGDGPVAGNLPGSPLASKLNLSDVTWYHGDRPDQVMAVVAQGLPDTGMRGWNDVLDDREIRAISAYVYYLAGRPVPGELQAPGRG